MSAAKVETGPQRTILLAEDLDDDVALLRRAFQRADVRNIQVVKNGEQAIDYLQSTGVYANREMYPFPAVLLLDLKMPRKSGLEVLEWVRSQESIRRLPVVAITSSQDIENVNRAYDLGINSCLMKPLKLTELIHLIKGFVEYWLVFSKHPTMQPNGVSIGQLKQRMRK
jgi:CheY-like chemotaxis protein